MVKGEPASARMLGTDTQTNKQKTMPRIDTYQKLDETSKVNLEVSIPELAERVCSLNYGTHRMLSAMVKVLRKRNDKEVEAMRERNLTIKDEWLRSPLADAIEDALNKGFYY